MSSLNLSRAIIAGHVVRDPELKQTPNGVPCTTFTVAVARKPDSGSETVSDFHTVIAWRGTAEMVCRYFKKGSAIYVDGKLRIRSYTDKNGVNRKIPEIVATDVCFVDNKGTPPVEFVDAPLVQDAAVPADTVDMLDGGDEDLPF